MLHAPRPIHVPIGSSTEIATMVIVVVVGVLPEDCVADPRTMSGVKRTVSLPCGPMPEASRWWCPGVALTGTVTVAENVPSGPAIVRPTVKGREWKVIVILAPGAKPDPSTVTRPPVWTVCRGGVVERPG